MKPRVFNRHHKNVPHDAVYIGRGSPFGNPFVIGRDGNRSQVISAYRKHLMNNAALLERVKLLKGRNLVCYCTPLACHGDVLLEVANGFEAS